jgi:autotransporter-associated beta strand protein
MKPKYPSSLAAITLAMAPVIHAASDSWKADAAGNWNNSASWTGANIPGSTAVVNSADVATFGFTLTAGRIVTVDANRNLGGITFSNTSAFGYTLSGGNILLSNGGLIQSTGATGAHTDTISSAIQIQGDGGSASFTNNALNTRLMSIGAVTGAATGTNITTLTLNGTSTGANAITGIIGNGSGGGLLALEKFGAGTWSLQNTNNSYSGGTTVNAGTLQALTAGSLGTGQVTLTGGALHLINNANTAYNNNVAVSGNSTIASTKVSGQSGDISHTLGTLSIGANTLTIAKFFNTTSGTLNFGATTLTGNASFATNAGTNLVLGATSGNFSITKGTALATGTLILAANNSFTGGTNIDIGTLQVGNGGATGNLGAGSVAIASGATLAFSRNGAATFSNAITGAGGVRVANANSIISLTNTSHTGSTLIQNGVLETNNTASNIVLGSNSTFNYGILGLTSNFTGALGTTAGNVSWAAGVNSSGGFAVMDAATRSVNIGGSATPDTLTVGSADFVKGTLGSGNARFAIGDINGLAQGTVDFKNSINLGSGDRSLIFVANGAAKTAGILSGAITGSGLASGTGDSLVKFGNGNLTLSGTNDYTGRTRVGGMASLILGSAGAFSDNTWMSLEGGNTGTLGGILGLGNSNLSADLGQAGGQVHFTNSGGFAAFGADRSVTLNGGAELAWASTTSFVAASQNLILGQAKADGKITLTNSIDLNGAIRSVHVNAGDGTVQVDAELSGNLSGIGGGLAKSGGGTLALSGTSSHTGATTVSAGTLLVNGSLGETAVNVASAATLGGSGAIAGTVAVNGTLAPGTSIESLATGSLSFLTASTLSYEMNHADPGIADLVAVNGQLDLTGTVTLSLTGAAMAGWTLGDKITLVSYFDIDSSTAGWNGGTFAGIADDSPQTYGSNTWLFDYNDTAGGLNFTDDQAGGSDARFVTMTLIPEPSALLLGALSSIGLLRRKRI